MDISFLPYFILVGWGLAIVFSIALVVFLNAAWIFFTDGTRWGWVPCEKFIPVEILAALCWLPLSIRLI